MRVGWFRTADQERIDPLTITDAHSRYLRRCQAVAMEKLAWSPDKTGQVELEYRRFLFALLHKDPREQISPPDTGCGGGCGGS